MAIRIVRLGTDRIPGEGLRIGTVRRPPRGIPKTQYASKNFYDVWLPTLAPSPGTVKLATCGDRLNCEAGSPTRLAIACS